MRRPKRMPRTTRLSETALWPEFAALASQHGADRCHAVAAALRECVAELNEQYFDGWLPETDAIVRRLAEGELAALFTWRFGPIPAGGDGAVIVEAAPGDGSVSHEAGWSVRLLLDSGLVFGANAAWADNAAAETTGTGRFIADLLLRLMVRQAVVQRHGVEEECEQLFGPRFVAEANRIGAAMGVAEVSDGSDGRPAAWAWPHIVRPPSYYGGDVTSQALEAACAPPPGCEPADTPIYVRLDEERPEKKDSTRQPGKE